MLSSASTFPCPSCNQLVMAGVDKCRHCSSPIDAAVAEAAAYTQDRVNRAYNDAMVIRNLAGAMWVAFLLRFIPFIGIVGWIAMIGLLFAVPIKLIIWQARFGGLQTTDPDYKKAKTNRLIALAVWAPLPVLLLFLFGLVFLAALASNN